MLKVLFPLSIVVLIYVWFSPLAQAQPDQASMIQMLEASLKASQSLLGEANDRVIRLSANGELLNAQVKKLQSEIDKLKAPPEASTGAGDDKNKFPQKEK